MVARSLQDIFSYWNTVLANPAISQAWNEHDALKGNACCAGGHHHDHHHHDHDHATNPTDRVRKSIESLSANETGEITPEDAQKLLFLQQFAKTQIRALEKSSLPLIRKLQKNQFFSFMTDSEKQNLINELTRRLADIESVLPPEAMERMAKKARNHQRRHDKQNKQLDGYDNWLLGTLSEDQRELIKALQWQTASGYFKPLKTVVGFFDRFAREHLKDIPSGLRTAFIAKLVWDSIEFMVAVTGAHRMENDAAQAADDFLAQASGPLPSVADDLLAEFKQDVPKQDPAILDETVQSNMEAILDARCMDKVNTDTSLVGMFIDNFSPNQCHEISQNLQTWFALATVTPRTMQAGQKAASEQILAEGSVAAEAYNRHHESASEAIEYLAFYDQNLHLVLLGIGALHGMSLVKKHGIKKAPVSMFNSLKQQYNLAKSRPLTWAGALTGWAAFIAKHNGQEVFDLGAVPYAIIGAMAGYLIQRNKIHLKDNKKFIFNLHAQTPRAENSFVPTTSLDQKQPRYLLKAFAAYALTTAATIAANNTGVLDYQSPQVFKDIASLSMGTAAWTGGLASWAVFDRLDDFLYHKGFYGSGIPIGAAILSGALIAQEGLQKLPGAPYVKAAWDQTVKAGKKKATTLALAAGLVFTPAESTSFDQNRNVLTITSRPPGI